MDMLIFNLARKLLKSNKIECLYWMVQVGELRRMPGRVSFSETYNKTNIFVGLVDHIYCSSFRLDLERYLSNIMPNELRIQCQFSIIY